MLPSLALAAHSFRRNRGLILGMGLLFGLFQAVCVLAASALEESQLFTRIAAIVPSYLRQALGASLFTMMSFTGLATLGYLHFAVVGSIVGLAVAIGTEPASEVERRFTDLTMARPMRRAAVVTRSVVLLVAGIAAVNLLMLGGTWAGLAVFAGGRAQWPQPRVFLSLASGLSALAFCWGGVGLAFGASARRRGTAGAGAGFLAVTFYLLDVIARVWEPARRAGLGRLSPFHYYNPIEIVSGQPLRLDQLAVLAGVGASGILLGYIVYARRDL